MEAILKEENGEEVKPGFVHFRKDDTNYDIVNTVGGYPASKLREVVSADTVAKAMKKGKKCTYRLDAIVSTGDMFTPVEIPLP